MSLFSTLQERLAIDWSLMEQLKKIDKAIQPQQVYLVVDGMTGQDAGKQCPRLQRCIVDQTGSS